MSSDSRRLRFALVSLGIAGAIFLAMHGHWLKAAASRPGAKMVGPSDRADAPRLNSELASVAAPATSVVRRHSAPVKVAAESDEAPAWAIPFGAEFWRGNLQDAPKEITPRGISLSLPPKQVADAIGRVSRVFEAVPGKESVETVSARYRARLDEQGLSFAPLNGASETLARFQTRSIAWGSQSLLNEADQRFSWQVKGNTAQTLLVPRLGIIEHYEARGDGLEAAWVLSKPAALAGDLVIEADLTGASFTPSDGVVAESCALPRIKVGRAQAVDRQGRAWPLTLEVAQHRMRVEVSADVLAEADYPLAIDPLLTPEFGLDSAVPGPSPSTRTAPVVAANEAGYLVVWSQGKTELADAGVYAARVDPAGVLLDPYGFVVSTLAAEQTVCTVAANSNLFLIAWATPHGTSLTDWDVVGARVLSSGLVLDPTPLPICTLASSIQNSPAAAANGNNFLVAWRDSRTTGIYGSIVGLDGVIAPTNGVSVLNGTIDQYAPAVAALGTNYLVVAQDYRKATTAAYNSDIYGARVSGAGAALDPAGFLICTNTGSQFRPAVASDGANYLVVWQDYDLAGNDIRGARVSAAGMVMDTNGFVICHAPNTQASPAVAGGETGFLVAWEDYRDSGTNEYEARILAARIQGDGAVLDPDGSPVSLADGGQCYPSVATRGGNCLVVWQDFRNNPGTVLSDVYGARGSWSNQLTMEAEGLLSGAASAQISPSAAALGTNYLVVWSDNRHASSNDWDICGIRLDAGGALLDSAPIWICSATNRQVDPTVTAGPSGYFVAWSDWRATPLTLQQADIFGAIVSPQGVVQQPNGISICSVTNDQSLPAAALLGTNFFVVWQDARLTQQPAVRLDVYGARITGDGFVLDPSGFAICTNVLIQTNPVVAANASGALVAWTDYRLGSTAPDIFGNRIALDGTVLDTNGFPICAVPGSSQYLPAIAADPTGFLVVWADTRTSSTAPDIYGAFVTSGGSVAPTTGFPIRVNPGPQLAPAVAYNGLDYLVTWQEARTNATNAFDVFGVQIDPSGQAGPVLAMSTNLTAQVAPNLAAGGDGRFLVSYQDNLLPGRQVRATLLHSEILPRLNATASMAEGKFQFRFRGALGERYSIEISDDLSHWTSFLTFTNSTPDRMISDPGTTNLPARFYRAVLLP